MTRFIVFLSGALRHSVRLFFSTGLRAGSILFLLWMLCLQKINAQTVQDKPGEYGTLTISPADTAAIMQLLYRAVALSETEPDSALILYGDILQQSKQTGFPRGIINALSYTSKIYADKGMYHKGLFLLNEAAWYSNQSEEGKRELFNIYNNIGIIYNYQSNYYQAAQYYYMAARMAEKYDSTRVAQIYNNLAGVLFHLELETQPLYYLEKARQLAIQTRQLATLTKILLNMGNVFMKREDWKQAAFFFTSVLDTARTHKIRESEYEALIGLGDLHQLQGLPHQTLSYVAEAEALSVPASSYRKNVSRMLSGVAWYQLKEYGKAEKYLQQALHAAEHDRSAEHMIKAREWLARLYAATGRYELAFQHLNRCMALKDSLQTQTNARSISQLEVRYQSAQKDKEIAEHKLRIAQQERNIERKNRWITGIAAGVAVVAALLFAMYRSYRSKQRVQAKQIEILNQEQEILNQKQEISQLRAMMQGEEKERARIARELHDGIGGMLSAVKMNLNAVKKQHPEIAGIKGLNNVMHILQDTSAEVRKTAHNLMPDILIRHKLPEALRIYCENINMANELYVTLQLHGDLESLDKSIDLLLYRTTQELLQNVVKHAQATQAVVQIIRKGNELNLIVEDNGTGFDTQKQGEGYGLQNLKFRIQALHGHISIESAEEIGTTIFIKLDLQQLNTTFAA